jgi:hypothetical protein
MATNSSREGRTARTFRLPSDTNALIKQIGETLKENDTEVLVRAVNYLNANLKAVAEADVQSRLIGLK